MNEPTNEELAAKLNAANQSVLNKAYFGPKQCRLCGAKYSRHFTDCPLEVLPELLDLAASRLSALSLPLPAPAPAAGEGYCKSCNHLARYCTCPRPTRDEIIAVQSGELARLREESGWLLTACKASLATIEQADLGGEVLFIEPPYQAAAVHETVTERLMAVIEDIESAAAYRQQHPLTITNCQSGEKLTDEEHKG